MMFYNSEVFVARHNNYLGVMAQALEGDCVELTMADAAEWIGLPSLNEKQKQAVHAFLEEKDVSLASLEFSNFQLHAIYLLQAIDTPPSGKL